MIKLLIIRFSSIGDIVLTTPVMRCIKLQVEDAQIHFLVKNKFSQIVKSNPYIDKVHVFNDNISFVVNELRKEKFDYIIDLHNNIRSYIVKSRLNIIAFSFNKINIRKWLLVNFKINRLPELHIVDRYLNTIKLFDVKNDNKGLDYFIPENDKIEIKFLPDHFQKGYVSFAIGAKHNTKKLPVEKIISICEKIKLPVILLGGDEDIENANFIKKSIGENIYNACGKYNINQSASLVEQSKLLITHDTGLMHIGAAIKKTVISIWGNTIPGFGMYPYLPGKQSKIFEISDLKCRPCSKLGKKQCPKKHFRCMNDIDEHEIANYVNNLCGYKY